MCGIAGIWGEANEDLLRRMTEIVAHRGPDDFGVRVFKDSRQQLKVHRRRREQTFTYRSKGHAEEMEAWAAFLQGKAAHPLPYEQSRASMLLTFATLDSIQQARAVELDANEKLPGKGG